MNLMYIPSHILKLLRSTAEQSPSPGWAIWNASWIWIQRSGEILQKVGGHNGINFRQAPSFQNPSLQNQPGAQNWQLVPRKERAKGADQAALLYFEAHTEHVAAQLFSAREVSTGLHHNMFWLDLGRWAYMWKLGDDTKFSHFSWYHSPDLSFVFFFLHLFALHMLSKVARPAVKRPKFNEKVRFRFNMIQLKAILFQVKTRKCRFFEQNSNSAARCCLGQATPWCLWRWPRGRTQMGPHGKFQTVRATRVWASNKWPSPTSSECYSFIVY